MTTSNPIDSLLNNLNSRNLANTPQGVAEHFFDSIGMMRGTYAPVFRVGFTFAVSWLAIRALRDYLPFWFYSDGTARPWVVTDPEADGAVLLPWWMGALVPSFYAGLFI